MRELVDEHYPDAERIRIALDNLSTHTSAALYERFPPAEARRTLSRIEFHFTPKHACWLNMVGINASIAGSPTRRCSSTRSRNGNDAATANARESTGSSPSSVHATSSAARTRRPPPRPPAASKRPREPGQIHSEAVL